MNKNWKRTEDYKLDQEGLINRHLQIALCCSSPYVESACTVRFYIGKRGKWKEEKDKEEEAEQDRRRGTI